MSDDPDDAVPEGVCTAPKCKCSCFSPTDGAPMYCDQKNCRHSIEWHHVNAREIEV